MHPAEIITKAAYARGTLTHEELDQVDSFSTIQQYALLACLYINSPGEFEQLRRRYPFFENLSPEQERYYRIIKSKWDGHKLGRHEIYEIVDAFCTSPDFPNHHMAAFLAGIFVNSMDAEETANLTEAMTDSGKVLAFPPGKSYVDKHSTGGVGDKVSLILAPLIVTTFPEIANPMMSGRGLGHTGGTLDKLESIPGFRTELDEQQIKGVVDRCGACIFAQLPTVAVADKGIYAIRDVTGLIVNPYKPTFALIISSILSKKFAEGCNRFVFDVKIGSGAFFPEIEQGLTFARQIVAACRGKFKASAVLTNMDQPLGQAIGNLLEVIESVYTLMGHGPEDLNQVTLELCTEMALLHDPDLTREEAYRRLEETLRSGRALEQFKQMVALQGGDRSFIERIETYHRQGITIYTGAPYPLLDQVRVVPVPAGNTGVITAIDSREIGLIGIDLGAGRRDVHDVLNPQVGFVQLAQLGQSVERGETLAYLFLPPDADDQHFTQRYHDTHRIEENGSYQDAPLILGRVG
ncbi:MAG: thymidine phosphorylase [Bradymonadales bacterium]|nr:thymidine phosphorylase [Bradymonadales bacterium]